MKNVITAVDENGILAQMGVEVGDELLKINEKEIEDVFDFRFLSADEYLEILIRKKDGEEWLLEVEKDEDEYLGVEFAEPLMDKPSSCKNKCVFCFIDQLPKGMRETLYFKDDDARLSFLWGNYITLTNLKRKEIDRIIYYRFSPINVSVHTTDPELRVKMTGNKNAANIMKILERFSDAGIDVNCQIVLVKGVNDGERLKASIADLVGLCGVKSVSVVPVGITKYRENLFEIEPFSDSDARGVLEIIREGQKKALDVKGNRFVYAADEFYLKAREPLPEVDAYDDFPQLENGVGMLSLFIAEFDEFSEGLKSDEKPRNITVVTGLSAYLVMQKLAEKLCKKFTKTKIKVIMIKNDFFGEEITVSGLMTGGDVMSQLKERGVLGRVLFPENCFRSGTDVFLDDLSLGDLEREIGISAVKVENTGGAFIRAALMLEEYAVR